MPNPITWTPPGIHLHFRPDNGDATTIQFDKATTRFQRDLTPRFQHYLVASLDVQFAAAFTEPGPAGVEVQAALYVEVLLAFGVLEAVAVHRMVIIVVG